MNKPHSPKELAKRLGEVDHGLTKNGREERDTLIPLALPTEIDHAVPEPDVLRIGESAALPRVTNSPRPTWRRQVEFPGGFAGSCRVEQFPSGSVVLLTWIDSRNRTQLNASADDPSPETAFARARELGNFPDEFFEALAAPL